MSGEQNSGHGNGGGDSEMDATVSGSYQQQQQQADQGVLVAPDPGCRIRDEEYNMRHPRRGVAIIFNHYSYADPEVKKREGTQRDCDALVDVLRTLRFEVRVYDDLTYERISAVLEGVRLEDHTNADCLFVAVMTHGRPGELAAYDDMYPVRMLWIRFVGNSCSSLVGKPKIFVIQACRGQGVDDGVAVTMETDAQRTDTFILPIYSDVLLAHSAPEGFFSWRNSTGSWFIQSLVHELRVSGNTRDLLTILTFVNQRVAVGYRSHVLNRPDLDGKKIIPSFTSMLTRLVFFRCATS